MELSHNPYKGTNSIHEAFTLIIMLFSQSCPTLCDPMDCSPPGSSVHRILQARVLEGLPFPPPGDLNPGVEPRSPALQADSLPNEQPGKPEIVLKNFFFVSLNVI